MSDTRADAGSGRRHPRAQGSVSAQETTSSASGRPTSLRLSDGEELSWSRRPLLMGVLNITPDSFSDGGQWLDPPKAIEHGLRLVEEGADLLDLGAESTRPGGGVYGAGAEAVSVDEELARLLPVVEGLSSQTDCPLSIDTRHGAVARECLERGASIINDISGLADPELVAAVAESGCPVVIMHSRGDLPTMQESIRFEDVVAEVRDELAERTQSASAGGIAPSQIVVDPGIGFGKTPEQNLCLLRHLDEIASLGYALLVGASRKSFIAAVTSAPSEAAGTERLAGSLAALAWAVRHGAAIVRVHDVGPSVQFLDVWQGIDAAGALP